MIMVRYVQRSGLWSFRHKALNYIRFSTSMSQPLCLTNSNKHARARFRWDLGDQCRDSSPSIAVSDTSNVFRSLMLQKCFLPWFVKVIWINTGLILGLRPAIERRRYFVTTDFNGFFMSNFQASFNDSWLRYLWGNCLQLNVTRPYW